MSEKHTLDNHIEENRKSNSTKFLSPEEQEEFQEFLRYKKAKEMDAKQRSSEQSSPAPNKPKPKPLVQNKSISYKPKNKSTKKSKRKFNLEGEGKKFYHHRIRLPLKRFVSLTEKEIRILLRDKTAMMITFAIPVVVILILTMGMEQNLISQEGQQAGFEMSSGGDLARIGLVDFDDSDGFPDRDLSQELVDMFLREHENRVVELYLTDNQSELEMMIGRGEINSFLIIPQLFELNLSIHLPVILPWVLDGLDLLKMQTAEDVIVRVLTEYQEINDFTGVFKPEKHYTNLPDEAQLYFAAAPFFIPLMLFAIGCLISSQSIVSDIPKDRMVLTPTNKAEMMAAKVMANFIIISLVSLLMLVISVSVGLQIRTSIMMFFLVMSIMALNAVLTGVAISAISDTPLSAFQYFIFILLFQTVILLFVENPNILMLLPIYNGNAMILNVVLRGQGLWSARQNVINIAVESVILYTISYIIFKRQKTML